MKRRQVVDMLATMRRHWFSLRHQFRHSGPLSVDHGCPLLTRPVAWLTACPARVRSTTAPLSATLSSRLGPEPSAVGYNDYDAERRTFKLEQPEYYNFASDVIDRWALSEQTSGRNLPAFWWVSTDGAEVKWSFTELADKSKRVASMLTGPCQLSRGDHVIVLLPKVPQWWLLNIACARAGVVMIPGAPQLTAKDIRYRINNSQAKCIIADNSAAEKTDEVISDCPSINTKVVVNTQRPDWLEFDELYQQCSDQFETARTLSTDTMQMFFTSGTTGHPKMTQVSCATYGLGHFITAKYWMDLCPTDVHWNLSDPGWAKSAYSNVFSPWINGSCVFIHSMPRIDPQLILQTLQKYPITTFCAPATGFRMLLRDNPSQYKFQTLRYCFSGGEPLTADLVERWLDATGQVIREGYGQTETVVLCCTPRCIPVRLGSLGKPAPGMDIRIVDADGNEVAPNTEGEIALRVKPHRPVGLFTGYYKDDERTASVFRGDYYWTGDCARRDDDGYIWFSTRADDVINSSGYRIGPHEVEVVLMSHPAVLDAAVVGSPDSLRGEIVKAFVVLSNEYKEHDRQQLVQELQKHVQTNTAPYKYPRKIKFEESLPKTISGKTKRSELRKKEWENVEV